VNDGIHHEYEACASSVLAEDGVTMIETSLGKSWVFPAGEFGIQFTEGDKQLEAMRDKDAPVWLRTLNGDARTIIEAIMTKDALRRMGYWDVRLIMPYVPYGRQDRATSPGTAFSLEVFARIINGANFTEVIVIDPHSKVTEREIDRLRVIPASAAMAHFPLDKLPCNPSELIVVAPDKGAQNRALECAQALTGKTDNVIYANKVRDPQTGYLKIVSVYQPFEGGYDKELLVIDDICDGGATFIELAKYLKTIGYTKTPTLYVTHGIFSKGLDDLMEHYREVICTDSFHHPDIYQRLLDQDVINIDVDSSCVIPCHDLL
jgi:ribose-phosphate pyrophosphokinase